MNLRLRGFPSKLRHALSCKERHFDVQSGYIAIADEYSCVPSIDLLLPPVFIDFDHFIVRLVHLKIGAASRFLGSGAAMRYSVCFIVLLVFVSF